jgi:hypothetical protein
MGSATVILVPVRTNPSPSGGYLTHLRLGEALTFAEDVHVIHYDRTRVGDIPGLCRPYPGDTLFVGGWGPDVEMLARVVPQNFVYWANSVGWAMSLPRFTPVLCASRFSMGCWGELAPSSPVYYLPNPLVDEFRNLQTERDIDVLVQTRKMSSYVLEVLIPRLTDIGVRAYVQEEPVPSMAALYNRSKVYIYDSRDYWIERGVSEGFGLPPLEALACGCAVFSSVNAGLSDFVDPLFVGQKVGVFSVDFDMQRVVNALSTTPASVDSLVEHYRAPAIASRWLVIAAELRRFFASLDASQHSVMHGDLDGPRRYWRHIPP